MKGKGTNIKDTAAARIGWFKKGLDKLSSLGDKLKSVGFNTVTAGDDSIYYGCITEWAEEHPTVKISIGSHEALR